MLRAAPPRADPPSRTRFAHGGHMTSSAAPKSGKLDNSLGSLHALCPWRVCLLMTLLVLVSVPLSARHERRELAASPARADVGDSATSSATSLRPASRGRAGLLSALSRLSAEEQSETARTTIRDGRRPTSSTTIFLRATRRLLSRAQDIAASRTLHRAELWGFSRPSVTLAGTTNPPRI
jgi:hypothetical protein